MRRRWWLYCPLGLHSWDWAVDVVLFGRRRAARHCRRCPAVKWLGPGRPSGSVQTG
jgi:hypothetical protein